MDVHSPQTYSPTLKKLIARSRIHIHYTLCRQLPALTSRLDNHWIFILLFNNTIETWSPVIMSKMLFEFSQWKRLCQNWKRLFWFISSFNVCLVISYDSTFICYKILLVLGEKKQLKIQFFFKKQFSVMINLQSDTPFVSTVIGSWLMLIYFKIILDPPTIENCWIHHWWLMFYLDYLTEL